jgi:membrane protease YdiL (CAAX protease family)
VGFLWWLADPFAVVGFGLAWPVFSGVDGRRSQVALGLTRGAGLLKEAGIGLLAVPAAVAADSLLALVFEPGPTRPHPEDYWLCGDDDFWRLMAIFSAVVRAPLLEESAFRGILYRFQRDAGRRLPRVAGIAAASLGTSILFAIYHDYGFHAFPSIALFGVAACALREWRGSLVAPIALHSGYNAYLTGLALAAA